MTDKALLKNVFLPLRVRLGVCDEYIFYFMNQVGALEFKKK